MPALPDVLAYRSRLPAPLIPGRFIEASLVAAVDGMRFVVPVPAAFARPNRKYLRVQEGHDLAERHAMTAAWAGRQGGVGHGARLAAHGRRHLRPRRWGTPRDRGVGHRIVQATSSSSSWNCWVSPTGPRWRTCPTRTAGASTGGADYGPLNTFARGKIDLREDPRALGGHPAGGRLDLHRHRPRLRRGDDAATRWPPDRAGRGDRLLRPDLQVVAHPQFHLHSKETPGRHIKHVRNLQEGRPALAPQDLPWQEGRSRTTATSAVWRTSSASSASF